MSKNMYDTEIYKIYGINEKEEKVSDIVNLIDSEEKKTRLVITNRENNLGDDCVNVVHEKFLDEIKNNDNRKVILVSSYLDIPIKEKFDEILVIDVLTTIEIDEYEKYLEYWINNYLKDGGEIFIQDLCLDYIFGQFFIPSQLNNNEITNYLMKNGIFVLYGKDKYKRRSMIMPTILSEILMKLSIVDIMMQQRSIMVAVKGIKK